MNEVNIIFPTLLNKIYLNFDFVKQNHLTGWRFLIALLKKSIMIEIKDLLLKFNSLLIFENSKIETVKKVIFEVIGIQIKNEDIKIKNNVIYLNIKPIYKNEIFLRKDEILLKLEKSLCKKSPQNIVWLLFDFKDWDGFCSVVDDIIRNYF